MLAGFVVKDRKNKKNHPCRFRLVQTGQASGVIYDEKEAIAEIRNLQLCNVKFRPLHQVIIGETVKMPLFWRQYADHENPLRNAGVNGELHLLSEGTSELFLQANGTNQDESILSSFRIKINFCSELESYVLTIKAKLRIPSGKKWKVTYNPAHGELEFCNLWPDGCFQPSSNKGKKYDACYIRGKKKVTRIPHHHLETPDKNNILLGKGDCFYWMLEDENPVVEILSGQEISAGICAYMWDTHFAYRVISPEMKEEVLVLTSRAFEAEYKVYTIDREQAETVAGQAKDGSLESGDQAIYLDGVNTFSKTLLDFPDEMTDLWPWTFETNSGLNPRDIFKRDKTKGFDDRYSLLIQQKEPVTSRWLVTTLGPAFGQPDFWDGARYRLTAYVHTEDVEETRIGIRLHRKGIGNIFDFSDYDLYYSAQIMSGNRDWQRIEVTTPPISPKPDRLHLILEQRGPGNSWFDNVLFERIPE